MYLLVLKCFHIQQLQICTGLFFIFTLVHGKMAPDVKVTKAAHSGWLGEEWCYSLCGPFDSICIVPQCNADVNRTAWLWVGMNSYLPASCSCCVRPTGRTKGPLNWLTHLFNAFSITVFTRRWILINMHNTLHIQPILLTLLAWNYTWRVYSVKSVWDGGGLLGFWHFRFIQIFLWMNK